MLQSHCRYLQSLYNQITSRHTRSHDPSQQTDHELSDFINKSPSTDWAHLSSAVAKETANICDRVNNLANEVSVLVLSWLLLLHLV